MKFSPLLLLSGLLVPALVPQEKPPQKKAQNSITRFFQDEAERLQKEVEGSWALMDYVDPGEAPDEGAAGGFASFHDGFLTLIVTIDSYESRMFRAREFLLLSAGAYRYRFDEQAMLQLASVMSVTNQTADGELEHESSNQVYEYTASLKAGVLELRNTDGVTITFRKITAKDFPDSAIHKLESRRSGQPRWEPDGEDVPR